MFRAIASGVFALLLFGFPHSAQATTLTGCTGCDGDLFALTYFLDSDTAGISTFDVTMLVDTSGNTLGTTLMPVHIDAVAIGINLPAGATLDTAMEFAPTGAANWTAANVGLNASGCADKSSAAFICASANSSTFAVTAPNASTSTTPYEWTFHISVPDSTAGGATSVFAGLADVKVHYDDVQGHLVSVGFAFTNAPPPSEKAPPRVPEPITSALVGTGLIGLAFLRRRTSR